MTLGGAWRNTWSLKPGGTPAASHASRAIPREYNLRQPGRRCVTRTRAQEDRPGSGQPTKISEASADQRDEEGQKSGAAASPSEALKAAKQKEGRRRQAESTDWIASALTRRFGLAGGLAWLGFLTFGVVSEQVKTRLEVASEERNVKEVTDRKEITTASGLKYTDLKIGGGQKPVQGYLTVVDFRVSANNEVLYDTKARGKPYVYIYGARPFSGGICKGLEEGMSGMRAGVALALGRQGFRPNISPFFCCLLLPMVALSVPAFAVTWVVCWAA